MNKEILNNLLVYHADRVSGEIKDGLKSSESNEDRLREYQDELEWIKERRGQLHDPTFLEKHKLSTEEVHRRLQRFERREQELQDLIEKTKLLSPSEAEILKEKMEGLQNSKNYIMDTLLENKAKEESEERERVKKGLPRRRGKQKN